MAKVKAKGKKKISDSGKGLKAALTAYEAKIEERYSWAMSLYEIQDDTTQRAIDEMVVQMRNMAGAPVFLHEGKRLTSEEVKPPGHLEELQRRSHVWIAVRLLVACAEWDIRIAKFKAPKKRCLRCGKKAA